MKLKNIKNIFRGTVALTLLMLLPAPLFAEEITLYDGTSTNDYVPIYGQWADAAQKCEMVFPQSVLQDLTGNNITSLKFYSNYTSQHDWNSNFTIFVKEVDSENIYSFSGTEGATVVYTGNLKVDSDKSMLVTFDTPYNYKGGNLLIGFYKENGGKYNSNVKFYGKKQNDGYPAVSGHSTSGLDAVGATARYFLPKTTITYEEAVSLEGPSLAVTDYENGSTFDFGGVPVAEGTRATFILANQGSQDLSIEEISVTGDYSIVSGGNPTTLAPGQKTTVAIATPANDAQGVLTITSTDPESPYKINLKSSYKAPAPEMKLSPVEDAEFGVVTEMPEGKAYTVSNIGDAPLTVTIATGSDEFSVEPPTLENIGPGEEETFTVLFNFDTAKPGVKSATVTVTPAYDETAAVTFNATATVKDPSIWEEDFEKGELPEGWSTTGWEITNKYFVGYNGTYVAYAGTSGSPTITTPRLYAEQGETLTFEVVGGIDTRDKMVMEYSHDQLNWTPVEGTPFTSTGAKTFTAPEEGFYYLRFQGKYGALDNFYGFRLALKDHDISIASQTIPATGMQYVEYAASVTVREMMGNEEAVSAALYFGENMVAEESQTVEANGTATFTLSFVPEESVEGADAVVVLTYAEGETLRSETVSVTLTAAPVWDENDSVELTEGIQPVVAFNYTPVEGWNSISVPFALNEEYLTQIFGESYLVYELKDFQNGVIQFKTASSMDGKYAAGYPYAVYVSSQVPSPEDAPRRAETDSHTIILKNVKVERTVPQFDEKNGVRFMANFSKKESGEDETFYEIDPSGTMLNESSAVSGFRGYVTLDPSITNVPSLSFDVLTGVETIEVEESVVKGIFNLNGQPAREPLEPGIYIIDGKKRVVR